MKRGDKVVPYSKSVGCSFENSYWAERERGEQFLIVQNDPDCNGEIPCGFTINDSCEYYSETDLRLFVENKWTDSLENPVIEGDVVYVSDESAEAAIERKHPRIYAFNFHGTHFAINKIDEADYHAGKRANLTNWKFVVLASVCKPKSIEIELTDDYTAVVSKDEVKVGCQTITKEKVMEVVKAFESLNNQ